MPQKKFKFRLEPLLKIRKHLEKEKQKMHAAALAQVYKQRHFIGDVDNKRLHTLKKNRVSLVGSISIAEALIYSRYLLKLKRDRLAGAELLSVFDRDAEKKRVELVEASKERKIFETLKDKQHQNFLKEVEKEDRKDTDDIVTTRYARKKMNEKQRKHSFKST